MWVLSFVYTLFIPDKIKTTENQMINSRFVYPDPHLKYINWEQFY